MPRSKPLSEANIGQRFGMLVIQAGLFKRADGRSVFECVCDCGGTKTAKPSDLNRGFVSSCGCAKRQVLLDRNQAMATHRKSGTAEYRIWKGIIERCLNASSKYYDRYGGRGITVCDRWRDGFQNFWDDMGARPSQRLTIERKDNDGPYSPENCIWATRKQQANNKRNSHLVTHDGVTRTVAQWAEAIGVKPVTIYGRLRRGMSAEVALTVTDLRRRVPA